MATWDATFEAVLRSVLPRLGPNDPLEPETDLRSLGLNSMGMVEVLVRLEGAYNTMLPDDALDHQTFSTPQNLWQAFARVADQSGSPGQP
jgi:acyl carrier protein